MSEELGPVRDELPDLRRWRVSIESVDDRTDTSKAIGLITVYQIVFPTQDPPDVILDAESSDLAEFTILFDRSGHVDPDVLDGQLVVEWPLTILDHVELDPAHRGHGIGPWAAVRALRTLTREGLVACYPTTIELPLGSDERAIQGLRLAELSQELGFELFRDNVYVLDAAGTALDDAIERFEGRIEP
jgi:hypothetical protein